MKKFAISIEKMYKDELLRLGMSNYNMDAVKKFEVQNINVQTARVYDVVSKNIWYTVKTYSFWNICVWLAHVVIFEEKIWK